MTINDDAWEFVSSQDPNCMFASINRQCAIIKQNDWIDRLDPRYNLPLRLREVQSMKKDRWTDIGSIAVVNRDTYVSTEKLQHVAIDQMPNNPWGRFPLCDPYSGSVIKIERGDICISRLMPTIQNGKSFLAWQEMTGSPEFIKVKYNSPNKQWLFYWLKSSLVKEYLLASVRGSSASQKRFTEDDLKACPVPILSSEEQQKYMERIEYVKDICDKAKLDRPVTNRG